MTQEKWLPVVNYEGLYEVSSLGNIKNIKRGKLHKGTHNKGGYVQVTLRKNNGYKICLVHRLVAFSFIDNLYNKPHINHKDGNRGNNKVENLEWCTPQENVEHAVKLGSFAINKGSKNGKSILNESQILDIRKRIKYISTTQLGKEYNITRQHILRIIKRKVWNHI